MSKFGVLLLFAAVTLPARGGTAMVSDAWFRALPGKLPAAGYFTLKNNGSEPIALTGASSSACGMVMLHKSEKVGGMNHMSMVDPVDVAQGDTVKFAPGGYHLMCMDPAPTMKAGATVPVTLKFADGATMDVEFPVKSASGK